MFEGLNGPPWGPEEVKPVEGVTVNVPAGGFTVRITDLVVSPLPFVVLVKLTVSL